MTETVLYRLKDLRHGNVISVSKSPFQIGRATTNDLSIPTNRYLSSCHCVFEFDQGRIYLRDTSSNGTLINRQKKLNKTDAAIELREGDIVHLVFRKDEPDANVIFQLEFSTLKRKVSSSFDETKENVDTSKLREEMEDVLTCVCCQDLLKNPICLEPCLHAFCSDCYSSWEKIQRTCPKCRAKVTNKKKNVMINSILDAFLKSNPDKSSTNDENETKTQIDETITTSTNESAVCRQCPSNQPNSNLFQCRRDQTHLLCQCCAQLMPNRQDDSTIQQSCEICHQHFCHLYFEKCQRVNCLGCLNQLKNLKFSPQHLANLVNENPVETQIVFNFLNTQRMNIDDFLRQCCQRLDRREFQNVHFPRNSPDVPSKKIVCYRCGLTIFKDLAFQFRLSMRLNDIHPSVLRHRENCYYGKECRTQFTKPGHAQKLNHACQQSRFD